jgi:hypothetical protein
MTAGSQAMFVVEYSCDRFCRIEVDLGGEPGQITLQQMREKADGLHRRIHEPELAEADPPIVDQAAAGRPATTVFLSAPGRDDGRSAPERGGGRSAPDRGRGRSAPERGGGRRR